MPEPISLLGKTGGEIESAIAAAPGNAIFMVASSQVRRIQSRVAMNGKIVAEYAAELANGAKFPPGQAVFDKGTGSLFLVDGIHRAAAYAQAAREGFPVTIVPGSETDARVAACQANCRHGFRRSNKDKEHAVMMLLSDPALCRHSNNYLARMARVSPQLVDKIRELQARDVTSLNLNPVQRMVCRNGSTYTVTINKPAGDGGQSKKSKPAPDALVDSAVGRAVKGAERLVNSLPGELRERFALRLREEMEARFFKTV